MTAYLALCLKEKIEILTDTALYDAQGVVRGFRNKVHAIPEHNVAVVTRGGVAIGEHVAGVVGRMLEHQSASFDGAMMEMAHFMRGLDNDDGVFDTFATKFEIMIAGFSESRGPVIHFGSTMELAGMEPFELHETSVGVSCGALFHERVREQIIQRGGLRQAGAALMDGIRHKAGKADYSIVGGSIDMTTLSKGAVTTEQIHQWGDSVGTKLRLAAPANVFSMAQERPNRQQRRAAKAKGRAA